MLFPAFILFLLLLDAFLVLSFCHFASTFFFFFFLRVLLFRGFPLRTFFQPAYAHSI